MELVLYTVFHFTCNKMGTSHLHLCARLRGSMDQPFAKSSTHKVERDGGSVILTDYHSGEYRGAASWIHELIRS